MSENYVIRQLQRSTWMLSKNTLCQNSPYLVYELYTSCRFPTDNEGLVYNKKANVPFTVWKEFVYLNTFVMKLNVYKSHCVISQRVSVKQTSFKVGQIRTFLINLFRRIYKT